PGARPASPGERAHGNVLPLRARPAAPVPVGAMKGVIFTQFLEFTTDRYGGETVARLTAPDGTPAMAHYRALGNYDHAELVALADAVAAAVRGARRPPPRGLRQALLAHTLH